MIISTVLVAAIVLADNTMSSFAIEASADAPRQDIEITDERGVSVGTLSIGAGEHAVKTTVEFCESHDLGFTYCANILQGVCRRPGISCTELARQPIQDQHGNLQTTVVIYEGQNPSKTILNFCEAYKWGPSECEMLLSRLCEGNGLQCRMLIDMPVNLGSGQPTVGQLRIFEGQHVVKKVMQFCSQHTSVMGTKECQLVIDHVCSVEDVDCPILFESPMRLYLNGPSQPRTDIGAVVVRVGQPPLHAVRAFCLSGGMSAEVCAFVKNQACATAEENGLVCDDAQQVLVALPIADEHNVNRGTLQVFIGQEPADAVETFVRKAGLPKSYFHFLVRMLCDGGPHSREVQCSRRNAALDTMPIYVPAQALEDEREANSPADQYFAGTIFVWDVEEEYADAVYNFFVRHKLPLGYRWPALRKLCANDVASCTRAEGLLASLPVKHEGKDKGELELLEHMEPAEAVLKFAEDKGMMAKRKMLMEYLCMTSGGAPLCKSGRALSHARRQLFDLKLTFMGLSHTIRYMTSTGGADTWDCDEISDGMGEECTHIGLVTAREFCSRFAPGLGPNNCVDDILKYMTEQLDKWENRRWAGKEYYEYLDVPIDADLATIEMSYRRQLRELGSSAEHTLRRQKLKEAYDVLSDPKQKAYYDQPCKEFPGLSGMCVKHLPDGGMNIICGGSKI